MNEGKIAEYWFINHGELSDQMWLKATENYNQTLKVKMESVQNIYF